MELRQLKYFVRSAETENFTQAADDCHVVQSTLSQQIRQLEAAIGVQLFERHGRHVSLTPEGRELLPYARRCLADEREGVERARDLRGEKDGTVVLEATYGMSPLLVRAVKDFRAVYPDVTLCVRFQPAAAIVPSLKDRKADVALAYDIGGGDPMVERHRLFASPLCAVVRSDHPLAYKAAAHLDDLRHADLVVSAKGMTSRTLFDRLCAKEGMELRPVMEINEIYTMLHLVETCGMTAIMSASENYSDRDFRSVPLAGLDEAMTAYVILLRDSYHSRALLRLVEQLKASAFSAACRP